VTEGTVTETPDIPDINSYLQWVLGEASVLHRLLTDTRSTELAQLLDALSEGQTEAAQAHLQLLNLADLTAFATAVEPMGDCRALLRWLSTASCPRCLQHRQAQVTRNDLLALRVAAQNLLAGLPARAMLREGRVDVERSTAADHGPDQASSPEAPEGSVDLPNAHDGGLASVPTALAQIVSILDSLLAVQVPDCASPRSDTSAGQALARLSSLWERFARFSNLDQDISTAAVDLLAVWARIERFLADEEDKEDEEDEDQLRSELLIAANGLADLTLRHVRDRLSWFDDLFPDDRRIADETRAQAYAHLAELGTMNTLGWELAQAVERPADDDSMTTGETAPNQTIVLALLDAFRDNSAFIQACQQRCFPQSTMVRQRQARSG
jgi:hypothetical protein